MRFHWLNSNPIGLKFTNEIEEVVLPFLDVLISKYKNGVLHIKIYRKKTATNSLLQWNSCHPRPVVKGIPKGQFLRVKRNCSDNITFRTQSAELRDLEGEDTLTVSLKRHIREPLRGTGQVC